MAQAVSAGISISLLVDNMNINTIIEEVKKAPVGWRWKWCEADACACSGCINRGAKSNLTKQEWDEFIKRYPAPLTSEGLAHIILRKASGYKPVKRGERMAFQVDALLDEIAKALGGGLHRPADVTVDPFCVYEQ